MMLANVYTKSIRERWMGLTITFVCLMLMFLFAMSVYRNFDVNIYQQMPDLMKAIMGIPPGANAASLAISVYMAGVGSWVLAGLLIASGSASIASEESNGTIGLLLGNPKSRTWVVLAKAGAMTTTMVVMMLAVWGTIYLVANILDVDLTGMKADAICLHVLMVALFHGFLAMAIGGWTGNRGSAAGITTGVMIVSVFATGLLPLIDGWEELARIFPWYYLNSSEPLFNGIDWGHIGILAGAIVVFLVITLTGVNRRDLKSHNVGVTLLDRLRNYPATQKIMSRLAGSARVSRIWVKTVTEQQALLVIVGYALVLTGILIGVLYQFMPIETMAQLVGNYPEMEIIFRAFGGGNFTTPEGFFHLEVFSMVAPAALMVVGIMVGTRAITGEESRRTMSLLLASPVRRSAIILEKTGAMVMCTFIAGLTLFIGVALGSVFGGLGMDIGNVAAASFLSALVGLAFGMSSLFLGALTGQGRIATFGSIGFALVNYLLVSFLPLNDHLAGYAKWLPYYYFLGSDPLVNGMNWAHALVFVIISAVFLVLSIYFFQRRDLKYNG